MAKISRTGGPTDAVTGQGFEDQEPEAGDESEPALVGQEGGEQFDPADYTAADVTAYLHEADEAEAARVIEAERGGKNRSSIVNYTR